MAVCLEGFGWSEDFTLPLPPPPPPPSSPPLSPSTPGRHREEHGSSGGVHHRGRPETMVRSSSMFENEVDTDAEIAAAVGGFGIEETTMNASPQPVSAAAAVTASPLARRASQLQLWHTRHSGGSGMMGGGQATPEVVNVVVEVGLKRALAEVEAEAEAGLPGGGVLRVNAEVAFSACGRRKVRLLGCGVH